MATTTSYLAQLVTIQYIVDSEEDEPQAGWLYSNILQKLRGQPEMKAANLSKLIVDEYESWYRNNGNIRLDKRATQSAVNMSKIKVIADAVNQLSDSLSKNLETEKKNLLLMQEILL